MTGVAIVGVALLVNASQAALPMVPEAPSAQPTRQLDGQLSGQSFPIAACSVAIDRCIHAS